VAYLKERWGRPEPNPADIRTFGELDSWIGGWDTTGWQLVHKPDQQVGRRFVSQPVASHGRYDRVGASASVSLRRFLRAISATD
jgi:hypothetical protein